MQTLKEVNDFFKKQDELQDMKDEIERLRGEIERLQRTSEFWKANHLAADAEIKQLRKNVLAALGETE